MNQCELCSALHSSSSPFDVATKLIPNTLTLIPTVGMLVPGYFLAVTNSHLTSFSQLEPKSLGEINTALEQVESELRPLFGSYLRFESGSDNKAQHGSNGSCIEHAHIHLLPLADVARDHLLTTLCWKKIQSYEDIHLLTRKPYAYLKVDGLHYTLPLPNLPSQWLRREIADLIGATQYDWLLDTGVDNLAQTFHSLAKTSYKEMSSEGLRRLG